MLILQNEGKKITAQSNFTTVRFCNFVQCHPPFLHLKLRQLVVKGGRKG